MHARRQALSKLAALVAATLVAVPAITRATPVAMEIWKDPSCGCCTEWVEHLRANGFAVKVNDTGNGAARAKLGMPIKYGSCHTGRVGSYAIEGHVPAREIHRLLAEKPKAIGLAVPGMPVGSPGMEQGSQRDPYDVLLVRAANDATVFASYR